MDNENIEETNDNPVEETIEEEKPKEETETPKEKTERPKEEFSDREKKLYARTKQAEEDAKKAKAELANSKRPVSDIDAILEVQQATKGLDPTEVSELKLRATAQNSSLSEARKNENFSLWQEAHRGKVEKEKQTLEPSTKQNISEKPFRKVTPEELTGMPVKEKEEYLKKMGLLN